MQPDRIAFPRAQTSLAGQEPTPGSFDSFSPAVREAWQESFMAELPGPIVASLLEQSREAKLLAGEIFYRGNHHSETATLALVVDGLLRIFIRAADGRQATLRYAERGAVVGLPSLLLGGALPEEEFSEEHWLMLGGGSLNGAVLQNSLILKLPSARFRKLARNEASVSWPLSQYLARLAVEGQLLLAGDLFLPVRSRVARHLLDLAVRQDGNFVVTSSHQQIADAIGSVREVVSRVLRRMQKEGLVERRHRTLVLCDTAALHSVSRGREPQGSNRAEAGLRSPRS